MRTWCRCSARIHPDSHSSYRLGVFTKGTKMREGFQESTALEDDVYGHEREEPEHLEPAPVPQRREPRLRFVDLI